MARELRLDTEIGGEDKVIVGFDRMAHSIDNAGDQAKQTNRELGALSRQITATEAKMALLTKQFNASGDSKFIREFAHERKSISGLKQMQAELDRVARAEKKAADEAERLARKVAEEAEAKSFRGRFSNIVGRVPFVGGALGALGPGGTAGIGIPLAGEAGGLVAGAGLLTAGLGGIAAGVAGASQQKEVKDAFARMVSGVAADFKADTRVFVQPLVESADIFGDAWKRQEPALAATFAHLADDVKPLAEGLAAGVENALPGIERAAIKARPVLDVFSKDFGPRVGKGIGDFFDSLGKSSSGAADAVHDLGVGIKEVLDVAGGAVRGLSAINELIHEIDTGGDRIPSVLGRQADFITVITGGSVAAGPAAGNIGKLVHRVDDLGGRYTSMFDAAEKAAKGIKDASDAIDAALGKTLDLDEANDRVKQDYFDLKDAISKNGKALDDHSEKGLANRQVLRGIIEDLERQKAAYIEANKGTLGLALATQNADAALAKNIESLRAWGIALGLPKAQLDAILAKYLAILNAPNITKFVSIKTAGGGATIGGGQHVLDTGGPVDWVPKGKPTLATIHGGERVLTAEQAREWESGGGYVSPRLPAGAGGGSREVVHRVVLNLNGRDIASLLLDDPHGSQQLLSGLAGAQRTGRLGNRFAGPVLPAPGGGHTHG